MRSVKKFLTMVLVFVMLVSMAAVTVSAATGTKPADGTVYGEPFDTKVSANHRIPGLVVHNGMLIASADARWDYEKDGGGMDLVVSRSADGKNWSYTYAGYLGDNGNVWNANSTTLMDPVIISDGDTLYLLADMYPAGYSISSFSTTNTFTLTGTGYNAAGNLLLSANNRNSYDYYLKDGQIYSTSGAAVSGFTVDGWFNLYQDGAYVTNLLFADSPYQLYPTSYICMLTSEDDGKTWSDPTMLNVKPEGTSWMVLGPGSGLVTASGKLAFTAYDGSSMYLIYGTPSTGWNRVKTSAAGNESSIIELNDGTIRAFVKRGGSNTVAYVDFTKTSGGYSAGSLVSTGDANFSNCMVSSLHYSKTLNGQEVVLVCCPSKSSGGTWAGRFNGKIYAYTLDSSNAMTLIGTYQINNSFFAYSNMAELSDGTIGLLYEDDCISYAAGGHYGTASHISYTTVNLESVLGVTFDAPAHTYTCVVTEPTCTAAGCTTYTCTDCGDSYTEEIPALGHNYETVTVEATCETAGSVTTTCANCGDSYAEELPALEHDYEAVTTEPSCGVTGSTTYTCVNCGDSYADEIPALEHDYEAVTVEPTCDQAGSTTYTCVNCGDSYTADEVAALSHSYETEITEATCTTDGGTVYTCTTCGHSYIDNKVAAYGHDYETVTVEATCEADGCVTTTCANCGDKTEEVIPALGHNYETETVDATCETAGSASKTCTVCGDKTEEVIPALGHDYKTTTVEATCEADGCVTTTCARCGDETVETIPALGHDYKTTTVEATCENDGCVTTACANCGDATVETLPALGHAYSSVTVDATCTAAGYTYHTCANCGDSYTSDQTAALGHSYTSEQVDNSMVYTCTICGNSYSESLAVNYTYNKVSVFAADENYVITLYSGRKYYALTHANNTLSVQQVTVSGSQITSEITEDMLWTYNGGKLSYTNGANTFYLYAKTSNGGWGGWFGGWGSTTTLTLSTTNYSTVSFSGNRLKVGSNYLRYSGNQVSLNRSATTTYLFQQNEE